jgi:hypothetical protein
MRASAMERIIKKKGKAILFFVNIGENMVSTIVYEGESFVLEALLYDELSRSELPGAGRLLTLACLTIHDERKIR